MSAAEKRYLEQLNKNIEAAAAKKASTPDPFARKVDAPKVATLGPGGYARMNSPVLSGYRKAR